MTTIFAIWCLLEKIPWIFRKRIKKATLWRWSWYLKFTGVISVFGSSGFAVGSLGFVFFNACALLSEFAIPCYFLIWSTCCFAFGLYTELFFHCLKHINYSLGTGFRTEENVHNRTGGSCNQIQTDGVFKEYKQYKLRFKIYVCKRGEKCSSCTTQECYSRGREHCLFLITLIKYRVPTGFSA